ncbi:MAG TPA: 30S ribosomal protein S16 [Coriobacteriia bacterium]
MAVKIRLARAGAKKAPFYRVIAADGRSTRDGRFLEILGRYNPRTEPSFIELDLAKVDAWIGKGAQPTEAAAKLIAIARGDKAVPEVVAKPSKKVTAKVEADKKAAADEKAKAEADKKAAAEAAAAAKAEAAEAAAAAAAEPEIVEEAAAEPEVAADEAVADAAEPAAE